MLVWLVENIKYISTFGYMLQGAGLPCPKSVAKGLFLIMNQVFFFMMLMLMRAE
jgi:hypothetical protein